MMKNGRVTFFGKWCCVPVACVWHRPQPSEDLSCEHSIFLPGLSPQKERPGTFLFRIFLFAKYDKLFNCNFSTFSFKFSLDFFSFFFANAFFKHLWSAVNGFFSFLKAKTCKVTNNFDNFNFVRANFC